MAICNTVYENEVIASQLKDNLATRFNARNYMTIDNELAESAGMIKKIHTYKYEGKVEVLAEGQGNTVRGRITFDSAPYEVKTAQQVFDYTDEEFMQDPKVVDYGVAGASNEMVNDITKKYFDELKKANMSITYTAFSYDSVVDGIALMNLEDESGLFLIVGNDLKATIRKDADFKSKELGKVIADGAVGTLCGVPVIVSKYVGEGEAYLATKEAITLFTKKDNEVEQDRDKEKRKNTVILRMVNLVALTDATKVVKFVKQV